MEICNWKESRNWRVQLGKKLYDEHSIVGLTLFIQGKYFFSFFFVRSTGDS